MRIDKADVIAGMPALEARGLIQKCVQFYNGFTVKCIARKLAVTNADADVLIMALECEGYVERCASRTNESKWIATIAGCALAQSSAAKKIKRATADRHYNQFIERLHEVNASDKYLYQVTKSAVFGSYLTGVPTVSDIDIFIWLERKVKSMDKFSLLRSERTQELIDEGRVFSSYGEQIGWPELDVRKYLKNGSRVISIQSHSDGAEDFDYQVIYDINDKVTPLANEVSRLKKLQGDHG